MDRVKLKQARVLKDNILPHVYLDFCGADRRLLVLDHLVHLVQRSATR